jgi:hypothetical protein
MSSTEETTERIYPTESLVGLLLAGILVGLLANDLITGLLFFALAVIIYLLFRILRAVELIAAKL